MASTKKNHYRQQLISYYLRAKDNNKPFFIKKMLDKNAVLTMHVKTDAIDFPPKTTGIEAFTQLLVNDFNKHYENVFTFCITDSITETDNTLSCLWLVAMTEQATGQHKVGYGKYDWHFITNNDSAIDKEYVSQLDITIEHMDIIDRSEDATIFNWLNTLPYPWIHRTELQANIPAINGLQKLHRL